MIIIELIFGFLIEVLFEIPGAFFRWLYFGRRESFSNFLKRNSIFNYIISFLFITVIGLSIAYFYNSKSVENCILDMKFQRENENPGPDLITFKISSNSNLFESNIEQYGLVEVIIDDKKSFKTLMFEISKIGENQYELNVNSPYFTYKTNYSEEKVYSFFNNKGFKINITLDGKKFIFMKC